MNNSYSIYQNLSLLSITPGFASISLLHARSKLSSTQPIKPSNPTCQNCPLNQYRSISKPHHPPTTTPQLHHPPPATNNQTTSHARIGAPSTTKPFHYPPPTPAHRTHKAHQPRAQLYRSNVAPTPSHPVHPSFAFSSAHKTRR